MRKVSHQNLLKTSQNFRSLFLNQNKMSKKDVLKAFKALHRITQKTFEGDKRAIIEARQRINLEFKKDIEGKEIGKINGITLICNH